MPLAKMPPGLMLDLPAVSAEPYWRWGVNIRSRMGMVETLGLFGPLRNANLIPATPNGKHITLPGASTYRMVKAIPNPTHGQIAAASVMRVMILQYDPTSLPGTGTRWTEYEITPAGLPDVPDIISDPGVGRVEIAPVWWVAEQEDIVIFGRSNDSTTGIYSWNRNPLTKMTPIAGSPHGAVGAGIVSRILVLLGASSFTDPDPQRYMTIRWSDRFNFAEWTPSDINISGEMQLDGGSRIIGGGVVGKGVVAWTDTRMALLTETGDPDSVFSRRYIDGSRGLMANLAWCEADGAVWWYDETRNLNVWDGGTPQQIDNPLRLGTLERLGATAIGRAYLVANPEFNEIILWVGMTDPNLPGTALVYNYADKAWSLWRLSRSAWSQRIGEIRNIGIDHVNKVWQHDLDSGLVAPWLPSDLPAINGYNPLTDVSAYSWSIETNLISTDTPEQQAYHLTRYFLDVLPAPGYKLGVADEYVPRTDDTFTLTVTGYGEATLTAATYEDSQEVAMGQPQADFRVGGKAIRVKASGTGATVWRFGATSSITGSDGER